MRAKGHLPSNVFYRIPLSGGGFEKKLLGVKVDYYYMNISAQKFFYQGAHNIRNLILFSGQKILSPLYIFTILYFRSRLHNFAKVTFFLTKKIKFAAKMTLIARLYYTLQLYYIFFTILYFRSRLHDFAKVTFFRQKKNQICGKDDISTVNSLSLRSARPLTRSSWAANK